LKGESAADTLRRHSGSLAVVLPIGLEHVVHRAVGMLDMAVTAALSLVG
jgi:hypothetical protein